MFPDVAPRYRPEYRQDEIGLICTRARQGVSLALVGVAGVGKSNLVNFLRSSGEWRPEYLGPVADCARFVVVNSPSWESTPESLWRLMLSALLTATGSVTSNEERNIIPLSEADRILGRLQDRLRQVCQELRWPVMFVLDDFDPILERGPLSMLETLYGLRNDGNRGMLSYLVLVKRLPHLLGQRYGLGKQSKFYDLFRHNIYPLGPYTAEDAQQMLAHLNASVPHPLAKRDLAPIQTLAGGHAHLLTVIFQIFVSEGVPRQDAVRFLAAHSDVKQECERLLQGLHPEEQEAALRFSHGRSTVNDTPVIRHLMRRGLVIRTDPPAWFSPVFDSYIRTQ